MYSTVCSVALIKLSNAGGDGPRRGGDAWAGGGVVVVGRGGGAPLRAQLLVEPPDELVRLPVHLRVAAVPAAHTGRWRLGGDAPQGVGRRRGMLAVVVAKEAVVVVVEHRERPGHVRRVVVVVLQVPVVAAAGATSQVGGGRVAAAELDLAAARARGGLVRREARVLQRAARGRRPRASGVGGGEPAGGGVFAVVEGQEVAEGLAGDLAAVEEEVEVHGELAPGRRHAAAPHIQHGAEHAPHPPRHARRRHHALLLLRHLCFFSSANNLLFEKDRR
jgi:hypothetical protein